MVDKYGIKWNHKTEDDGSWTYSTTITVVLSSKQVQEIFEQVNIDIDNGKKLKKSLNEMGFDIIQEELEKLALRILVDKKHTDIMPPHIIETNIIRQGIPLIIINPKDLVDYLKKGKFDIPIIYRTNNREVVNCEYKQPLRQIYLFGETVKKYPKICIKCSSEMIYDEGSKKWYCLNCGHWCR